MQPMPAAVTAWRKMSSVHVAGGEDAGDVGRRRIRRASRYSRSALSVDLPVEQLGRRLVADRDEDAVGRRARARRPS